MDLPEREIMSELSEGLDVHKVSVSLGYTRNMGNFESLRVDIGLEASGRGRPDQTFDKVYGWVEGKLMEKVDEVEEELKKAKE